MTIELRRIENIDRENRGFVVDQVEAICDGEIVGYLKIENIPEKKFREFYPTIFNYLGQIGGRTVLVPYDNPSGHYRDFTTEQLIRMLRYRPRNHVDNSDFSLHTRQELLAIISEWEAILLANEEGKAFRDFRLHHVDKPFVAYITVDRAYRRQGIATALYLDAAEWFRERGLCFRSSRLQSEEAKSVWDKFTARGMTRRDKAGRLMLYPHRVGLAKAA